MFYNYYFEFKITFHFLVTNIPLATKDKTKPSSNAEHTKSTDKSNNQTEIRHFLNQILFFKIPTSI